MTIDLTICIPIGPGHDAVAQRARDSVKAQTIPVAGAAWYDEKGRGAGWARNELLKNVTTPYVAFLDADDWLEPTFAAEMLGAIEAERYVYSSWLEAVVGETERLVVPSATCYCFEPNNWWNIHLITAVVPTEWIRQVGGFDETLKGMEDTVLWHELHNAGHCGKLVNKPLVHYTDAGKRSLAFRAQPDYLQIKDIIGRKYNRGATMPCCQGQGITNEDPQGERQPGDVLARAMGAAHMVYVGRQSDRLYRNVGHGQLVWADPRDVASDPIRFQLVSQADPRVEPPTTASDVASIIQKNVTVSLPVPPTRPPIPGRKSIGELKKLAGLE